MEKSITVLEVFALFKAQRELYYSCFSLLFFSSPPSFPLFLHQFFPNTV